MAFRPSLVAVEPMRFLPCGELTRSHERGGGHLNGELETLLLSLISPAVFKLLQLPYDICAGFHIKYVVVGNPLRLGQLAVRERHEISRTSFKEAIGLSLCFSSQVRERIFVA